MIKNIFYIVILTIVLVFFLELVMFGLYTATGSSYVSNANEARAIRSCHHDFKKGSKKPIRAAIFGGSSSAGHAAPITFSGLLCDSGFNNNNDIEITNYAEAGAPFSGFQSEIIKSVMEHYDVIIIYSGHNEFWNQIYLRDTQTLFQNGITSSKPELVHKRRLQQLNIIKNKFNSRFVINELTIIEYSRIYYFAIRAIARLAQYIKISSMSVKMTKKYPKKFYYSDYFVTQDERKNMVNHYKKNIIEISNRLRNDQKLIISTVMSNDLFPPIADIYTENYEVGIDTLNKKLRQLYLFLSNNEYDEVEKSVNTLPKSAHRYYLEGILCLKANRSSKKLLPKNCLSILKKARELDGLVFRVLPEINSFIRQFQHDNVIIVDPVEDMLNKVVNIDDYKEYFVDFQHPSHLGHTLIAENILFGLLPSHATSRSYNVGTCGIDWEDNGVLKYFYINTRECALKYNINLRWLNLYLEMQPTAYQYDYYKSRSEMDLMALE